MLTATSPANHNLAGKKEVRVPKVVVVLGASPKLDRYSNKAVALLKERGFDVIPVHPRAKSVQGISVVADMDSIEDDIDTLTVYVNRELLSKSVDTILRLKPGRVIFNPGTESEEALGILERNDIQIIKACTLVLLKTGQF